MKNRIFKCKYFEIGLFPLAGFCIGYIDKRYTIMILCFVLMLKENNETF